MDYSFKELFDLEVLANLCESFTKATGAATAILDLEGNVLVATGWRDICTCFHRRNPETAIRCTESDTVLAGRLKMGEQYNIYRCRNGMLDAATPIVIAGTHIGNLFTGQFLFEPPDRDFFRRQAAEFGFEEKTYLKALDEVPIFSEEQIRSIMDFLSRLAEVIGETGLARLKLLETNRELKREIAERAKAEDELAQQSELLNNILSNIPHGVFWKDRNSVYLGCNKVCAETFGLKDTESIVGKTEYDLPGDEEEVKSYLRVDRSVIDRGVSLLGIEETLTTAAGGKMSVVTSKAPLRNKDGEIFGLLGIFHDVTELKQAEEALKESEERFRLIFKTSPEAISLSRLADGVYMDVNEGYTLLSGFSREDVLGKTSLETGLWHDPSERERVIQQLSTQGYCDNMEVRLRRKDGSAAVGLLSARIIQLNGVKHVISIVRDITERKRIEDELSRRENLLQKIFEILPVGLWITDRHGRLLSGNPTGVKIWGGEPKVGKEEYGVFKARRLPSGEEIAPDDWSLAHTVNKGVTIAGEMLEIDAFDGQKRIVLNYTAPVLNEAGSLEAAIVVNQDITELKRAEELLRAGEEKYRSLFQEAKRAEEVYRRLLDSSADAIAIYDIDGNAQFVSPAFTRIFGWTPDEVLGRRIDFVPETEKESSLAEIQRVLAGGFSANYQTRRLDKNGRVLDVTISASRFDDHEGNPAGMLVILRDVTQTKDMEIQLRQALKMEAIGTLAGGIAHDFNNLLQAINGYTQLLLMDRTEESPDYAELSAIGKAADRAAGLVRQLLLFSRKLEGARRPVDLNKVVSEAEAVLRRTIPKMIDVDLHLSGDLWSINADPVQMEQILLNLGSNAADAMPDGGQLFIETRNIILDEDYCREHLVATVGRYVLLTVSDTGHGMDKETIEHIFEPFYTTKEVGRGTGLGLASVYGVVKGQGGFIQCYSEPGQGTTFRIYLPAGGLTDSGSLEAKGKVKPRGGTETILVVDDDAAIRDFAAQALQRFGYTVIPADSGENALEAYARQGAKIDLVILDLGMPGMGGHKCLVELLRMNPSARVLIASGYSENSLARRTLESGAAGFIGKPYLLGDLLASVRRVLETA